MTHAILDALALVELGSIARGYRALDAMVKRSPVTVLEANLVEPGKYLLMFAGGVAEVEEGFDAALEVGADQVLDKLLLPMVHQDLLPGLAGRVQVDSPDTIGVIEGRTVAASLLACDRALKDAHVTLAGLRLTPGLGGRAYFVVHGRQHDVEAAIEVAEAMLNKHQALHCVELVARPHEDFLAQLLRPAPFNLTLPGGA